MAQQQVHRELGLAGLGEFGPVGGDRGLQVEQPAVDQAVGADRGQAPLVAEATLTMVSRVQGRVRAASA